MDINNAHWILSDGQQGYPAGSFYNRIFRVLTGLNDYSPVETLFDLFSRADMQRTRQLNEVSPGIAVGVGLVYNGDISEPELREMYPGVLDDMPGFVSRAFPECQLLVEQARAERDPF